jgi:hypothetical protein
MTNQEAVNIHFVKYLETNCKNSEISMDANYLKRISAAKNVCKTVVELTAFRHKINTERHFICYTRGNYAEVGRFCTFYRPRRPSGRVEV